MSRIIQATLVMESDVRVGSQPDIDDAINEEMRILRETYLSGGTSFSHLDLEMLDDPDDDGLESVFAKRTFSPDDEPTPVLTDEDLEEAEASLDEALATQDDVPWAPIPTAIARSFLKNNEDALIELIFPTVYEEDRSAKIKDLATAQALGYISHQRSAMQSAKELGFDNYTYEEEQAQIKKEVAIVPKDEQDIASGIGQSVIGLPKPGGSPLDPNAKLPGAAGGPGPGTTAGERSGGAAPDPKRADISGVAQSRFRQQQRQAESLEIEDNDDDDENEGDNLE